jgi:hypothetical protein
MMGTFSDDRKLTAQLSVTAPATRISTVVCTNGHNTFSRALLSPKSGNLQNAFDFLLDSSFNILDGTSPPFTDDLGNVHTLRWHFIQVKSPPKDTPR